MTRPSSSSAALTLVASVACCILHGDGIATNKAAALIHMTPYSSSRRKSGLVRRLHQRQRRGYEDENVDPVTFYPDDGREPPQFHSQHDGGDTFYYTDSMKQHVPKNEAPSNPTPDYKSPAGSARISTQKSKNAFSDGIDSIVSRVLFRDTRKQSPHRTPQSRPISSGIPNLSQMISISDEDMETFANNAKAGGKVVSNFVRGAILNTAKLAIEVLEQNKDRHPTEGQNVHVYNDVCEFDDDLCREIQDALAASSSSVESTKGKDGVPSPTFLAGDGTRDEASDKSINTDHVDTSREDKTENHYYLANTGNNSNKVEEYYRRSLEEQLAEWEGRQRAMQRTTSSSRNDTAWKMSDTVDRTPSSSYPKERLARREQVSRSRIQPMPLLTQRRKDVVRNNDSGSTSVMGKVGDGARRHDRDEIMEDYAELFDAIQDAPSARRRNPLTDRKKRVTGRWNKMDDISESRYEAQDSVKVDITDEALAFARSLNLDVYDIYLSRDDADEDAVITLEDVLGYYDRVKEQMGMERMERSAVEDRHQNMEESIYRGMSGEAYSDQRGMGLKRRSVKDSYQPNIDGAIYGDLRNRRSIVASEPPLSGKVTPSVRYRHVIKPSRPQTSNTESIPPNENERVPRFRQYPAQQNASSGPLRPSDRRNIGSRREIKSKSSLSQLIDPHPERSLEYSESAAGVRHVNTFSTVTLAKLVQNPTGDKEVLSSSLNAPPTAPLPFEQISTAQFREPYQGGRINDFTSYPDSEHRSDGTQPRRSSDKLLQSNILEQTPGVVPPKAALSSFTRENESAYCTNDALLIAEKYGVDLRKVAAGSDEPISAEDVRHYIESRKNMRASGKDQYAGQRDSPTYIDNDLTYEEFASYFDSDTMGRLQRLQENDSRERIE